MEGMKAAAAQGRGRFWPASACSEAAREAGSCAFRMRADRMREHAAPTLALPPRSETTQHLKPSEEAKPRNSTLLLFLPGTGTPPSDAFGLLDAAADMGYHVVGLTYATLPVSVSATSPPLPPLAAVEGS
jgi:hypothetical protein